MVQDPKIRSAARPPKRPDSISAALNVKLEDAPHLLESLVASLSRGQALPEIWALLHEAASRDDRMSDLAFAYERLTQDRKLKFLPTAIQCEILMHAATFFADVFGDLDGATGYLEQVLAVSPTHPEAFAKMEAVLTASANGLKLADVYAAAATHRQDKDEQLALLRRAAELADGFSEDHERAIKIYQSLLRVDPSDARVRRSLEERLRQASKFRDVARLLEQALTSTPEPARDEAVGIRERLIALYVGELGEPERALPQVEEILRADPAHELARRTAHRLVSHKPLASRAAAALADAYAQLGTFPEAAAMLEVSLESLRGPKRADAQKRLGILKQDKLDDAAGAHSLLEAVVALDPGDDEVRRRYGELSKQLGKQLDAARLLSRAATGVKEQGLKARLGTEVGEMYLDAKDPKRARSAFVTVVDAATADDPSVLPAVRALAELYAQGKEHRPLAQMLEMLSRIEPHETARCAAAERLGRLAEGDLGDKPRAIAAYRSLLGSPLHEQALEALERLYAATESYAELIDVLEKRADLQTNASVARALALRAAELRTAHTKDRARAITSWMDFLGIYGPSREVHAKVIPLLEQEKKWDKLATILAEDLALVADNDRIPILLKLAQVRLARLEDPAGAIEAYRQVWAVDPKEPTARQALEKMLASPETRGGAADLLEPLYRKEGAATQLVRVLEARADGAADAASKMALLDEASVVAARDVKDAKRALELAGRALLSAVEHEATDAAAKSSTADLGSRLDALDALATSAGDAVRHAALLSVALGDRAVDGPALFDLAKRVGQALVSAGDPSGALAAYRRALAFEPSSRDLLGKIDGLLAEEGRPEERVVLYRAALAQAKAPERRRELLHAIGTIEQRDLRDTRAATETWRQALTENPSDKVALSALLDAYEAAGDWPALYDELGRSLPDSEGERRDGIVLKMGEVAAKRGNIERALSHFRELLDAGKATEDLLAAMQSLADASGDLATLEEVLQRRVSRASDAQEECAWLERLAEAQAGKLGNLARGAESYKRAGEIAATTLADEERARGLFERALSVAPTDREAAGQLFKLYVRGELWSKLPSVVRSLVENATGDDDAAARLLELEPHVGASGGIETFLSLAEGLLSRGNTHPELGFARARVLAADPARQDDAASAFRELMVASADGSGRLAEAFEAFLGKVGSERRDDRRFLLEWKADHAPDAQRVSALLAWAVAEEAIFKDTAAAVRAYRRILAIEPERADALEAAARLLLQTGDTEGALDALVALRESSEGATRRERDLEIADLLLSRLARPEDALSRVAPLIEAGPTDAEALGIVYRALEHPAAQENAAALLERAATSAEDGVQSLSILKTLLAMPKMPALQASRRRWFERLLDHYAAEPEIALDTALTAVIELPEDENLWERAEKLARALNQPALVAIAYRRVLDAPLDPRVAADLGRRAVNYQEEWFEDPAMVITLLRRVLEVAPDATWSRDRLKLAYGSAERWDDLFALYDDAVNRAPDEDTRADLLAEAAQAAKDFAADPDRAIGYFERLLALRPRDARVTTLLERLYERQGRIQPLIDLLTSELEVLVGDGATKSAKEPAGTASKGGEKGQRMRLRIAGLWLRQRHDEGAAFKLIEEVLAEDPVRAEAFALIEEIVLRPAATPSEANGDAAKLAASADERSSVLPPDFDAEPTTGSMPPPAPGASSSVVPPAGATTTSKSKRKKRALSVRERAASLLKDRYVAESKHLDLARVLEVELGLATSTKERARRHLELLTLKLDTLHDDRGAFEHAAALIALDPRTPGHRQTLAQLAERLSAWERFAEVLVATAESSSDAPLVARLLIEAAEVYRDKVAREERAIELFASVLALNPKDKALALSTARELDALLAHAARNEERCGVLEKIANLESDPAARRAALGELSRVAASEVRDPDRAIRAWRSYIDGGGSEIESWDGLILVLRGAERWADLIGALTRRSDMAEPDQAHADLVEIAGLQNEKLAAPDKAIAAWLSVRARFGVGEESFVALAGLLEASARWDDLAKLVLEETKGLLAGRGTTTVATRLVQQKQHAGVVVQHLLDRAQAIRVCEELFEVGVACWVAPLSDNVSSEEATRWAEATWWALDALVRMALEDHDYESAFRRLYDGSRVVFDTPNARQMRRQAAAVSAEHLGEPARAVAVYRELLTEDARDAVADASIPELARLYNQLGSFDDLTDLWEQQALRQIEASHPQQACDLWSRAAELSEKRLASIDRAIVDYQKSADLGSQSALRELGRLHRGRDEPSKAAEALERLTYQGTQDHLTADTLALVDAYLAAGDRERARARLERGVQTSTEPRPLRGRLRDFYREEEEWNKLADLLRVEAEEAEDKATRLDLLKEAASLHLEKRGDPVAAIPLLEQAKKLDVDDSSLGLTLTRALVSALRYEDASTILRAELERYGNRKPKERALVHFELSRVSLKMKERARALAELDLAAKIDPAHPGILHTLGKLSAEEGQLDRAQRTFRALLLVLGRSEPDAPIEVSRAEVLFELAAIAEKENDPDRAQELIESALHVSSENEREAESFERALRERGSYDLLARSLEARLSAAPRAETRASILRDLSAVYEERGALSEETRARIKGHADQTVRELAESMPPSAAPWAAIEGVYERLGESERQAEVLSRRIALSEGQLPSPAHADALYRLAKIRMGKAESQAEGTSLLERALEMSAEPDRAAATLAVALQIDPANERNVRLYERISRGKGREAALVDALGKLIDLGVASADETREAVVLALSAADEALAESILSKVLDREPDNAAPHAVWARIALAELCFKRGDLKRAADLKEQAAEAATPDDRRGLLLDVARAARGPLGDLPRAARILAALREREPADREIWEPLLEIFRTLEATESLIELIAETLPLIDSAAERGRLRLEQATVLLRNPATESQATDLLREVLDEDPSQVEAAILLLGMLEKSGRKDELASLLGRQLDAAKDRGDVASIVSLSMRLGALLEERGETTDALDAYHAALDWDATSKAPLQALVRLSEARGDSFEIADALEKLLAVETGEAAAALAMRVFKLRTDQGDSSLAERALEAGLKAHPASTELSELLIARYQARGAYQELSALLRQAFDRAPDNLTLLAPLLDAYKKIDELDPAISAVSAALERVPQSPELHRERAVLYEAMGRGSDAVVDFEQAFQKGGADYQHDFVQALERESARSLPPADRALKLRLAEVLCETGNRAAGRNHLAELLKRDAKDKSALHALARLEDQEQHWDASSAAYRRLLPLEDGEALVDVALKLCDACERADRLVDARSGLERALKASPANTAVRAKLRDLYRKTDAHGPLAQLILEDAAKETDVSGRFGLLLTAASFLLGQEGNPAQAVSVLEEARNLRPEDDEGVVLLGRAYSAQGRSADALTLLQTTLTQRKGRRSKSLSAMHREISHIYTKEGDLKKALESLTKAFDMDLHNGEIALELGLMAKDLDDQELASRAFRSVTFMKLASAGTNDGATPAAKGLSYFFLGEMARAKGDVRKARLMAQKAVIEDPTLEQAKALLEELKSA